MEGPYLIESLEHRWDDNVTWWKPNHCGYTQRLAEAGRYSKEEAEEICRKANLTGEINERCWKESDVFIGNVKHIFVTTVAVYK